MFDKISCTNFFILLDGLPWTYAWIVKCMLFLCIGVVIIILPFCLSGASFNFGLGPLLRFGIDYKGKERGDKKNRKGNSLENVKKRDPVQIILQVIHGSSNNYSSLFSITHNICSLTFLCIPFL